MKPFSLCGRKGIVAGSRGFQAMSTSSHRTIYSLGTSSRGQEEFIHLLKTYGIEAVVDVRRFPTSRYAHFGKDNLRVLLESEGIEYLYMGRELGGYRRGGYETYMETEEFDRAISTLEGIGRRKITAFLCAERLPWRCHRRFIGSALMERGWEVIHIMDEGRIWRPKEG